MKKSIKTAIPIGENYRITADACNWMAETRLTGKNGETWKTLGYYATPGGAVRKLSEYDLKTSGIQTLAEALDRIEVFSQTLTNALAPHIKVDFSSAAKNNNHVIC